MILAISYSLTGMHAGRAVVHRTVKGDQRWMVKLDIVSGSGVRHESEAIAPVPVPLPAIGPIAMQMLDEFMAEHGNVVRSAKWEAHFTPNPSQRKKPKRGRR